MNAIQTAYLCAGQAWRLPANEVRSGGREEPLPLARHCAWWMLMDLLGWSNGRIARLAGVDHGAVSHGVRRFLGRLETEPATQERAVVALSSFRLAIGQR